MNEQNFNKLFNEVRTYYLGMSREELKEYIENFMSESSTIDLLLNYVCKQKVEEERVNKVIRLSEKMLKEESL